jgi:anti-anti-sigma regulatory factor
MVVAGTDRGRTFPLEEGQTLVIGRGMNTETKLTDPRVSRVHCQVRLAGDRLHLTDAGSSTGTLVNNRRVVEEDIGPGDTFLIGSTRLRFDLGLGQEATTYVGVPAVAGPAANLGEPFYRHLKAHTERDALVLALSEHQVLDEELAESLRVELLTAVANAGARRVVVDFRAVKTVSNAIFRPLISLSGKLGEPGDRLVLCGLNALVDQVFRMSGMIDPCKTSGPCFETAADQAAALARLAGAG